MKIGLLVDGRGEYYGFPYILPRLGSPHQVLAPLVCDIQPFATPGQMALAASKKFPILLSKGVESIVVLIDRRRGRTVLANWLRLSSGKRRRGSRI